jgi:hypothetical protein
MSFKISDKTYEDLCNFRYISLIKSVLDTFF